MVNFSLLGSWIETHEHSIWSFWENLHNTTNTTKILPIPTIDLSQHPTGSKESLQKLTLYFQTLDLNQPLLIRNLWDKSILTSSNRSLSLHGLQQPPFSNITIDYFQDATLIQNTKSNDTYSGVLKPNGKALLGEIVKNITIENGNQKFGSQIPLEQYPHYIQELLPKEYVTLFTNTFGDYFSPDRIQHSGPFGLFPGRTTVPLFLAGGNSQSKQHDCRKNNHEDDVEDPSIQYCSYSSPQPRTDLHSEPIGNIAIQLYGEKRWRLISSKYSYLLQPSISRHGRAFFYSHLQPSNQFDPTSSMKLPTPHYDLITNAGDALWIPPWMWHRVDYIQDSIALAASIFQFRPLEFMTHNHLFAILVIPNLIKELLRTQTE